MNHSNKHENKKKKTEDEPTVEITVHLKLGSMDNSKEEAEEMIKTQKKCRKFPPYSKRNITKLDRVQFKQ